MSNIAITGDIEQQPLHEFAEKAYLDYSMYVILDRALPHIGDGLKPVQRRIVYAMSELGLKATAKYKKSARTVGDVLGKFHPHGDSACYEAMVLMAQPFTYRYPLIDGQGNWGSPDDPKSFAAMRYTESRLAPYAEVLLAELAQGTVEWGPNFDGTLDEPLLLPARLPNVLLNGSTGIAVGMATDVLPHNIKEVASACIRLLNEPDTTIDVLCEDIKGPDFPTAAEIITSPEDIKAMYASGNGAIRMRATYETEAGQIIVTALPHQVSGAKLLEQIAQQMQLKKLPMVADLRDESDHENPTRLVIVPRSNRVDFDSLMSHLFATTDLERSYRVNFNMIGLNGRPQVKNLQQILSEWLVFRQETVRRRLQFRLNKILDRLHILAGLLIAYLNLDEVIAIIREQEEPKKELMLRFNLTDIQTDAILDMKLRHLAKLEEMKIRQEQDELAKEKTGLETILNSKKRLRALVKDEIQQDAEKYGDERRSAIVSRQESKAMRTEDTLPNELMTVVLSNKGWVRAAKGHNITGEDLNYKAGDDFNTQAEGRSNQLAVFLDTTGRTYSLPIHTLPSARSQGEPVSSHINLPAGASICALTTGDPKQALLLASDAGYGFVTTLEDLYVKNKSGKTALKLPQNSKVLPPRMIRNIDCQLIAAITNVGKLLVFPIADLPRLARGKGNKIIQIPSKAAVEREEFIVDITILEETDTLVLYAGKRHLTLKPKDWSHYQSERGRRGNKLPRGFQRVDKITVDT